MEAGERGAPPPSRVTFAELRAAAEAAGEYSFAAELRTRKSAAPFATPSLAKAKAIALTQETTMKDAMRTKAVTVAWVCEQCGWRNRPTNLICGGQRSEDRPAYGCGAPAPTPVSEFEPTSASSSTVVAASKVPAAAAAAAVNNNQPFDSIPIMSNSLSALGVGETTKREGEKKGRGSVLEKESVAKEEEEEEDDEDEDDDDYLEELQLFDSDDDLDSLDDFADELTEDERGGDGGGSDAWTVAVGQPVEVWDRGQLVLGNVLSLPTTSGE